MALTALTDLRLVLDPVPVPVWTTDFARKKVQGLLHSGVLTGPHNLTVALSYRQDLEGGGGAAECPQLLAGPDRLKRPYGFEGSMRIGVYTREPGVTFAEMRVAEFPPDDPKARKRTITEGELDHRVGASVGEFLLGKGVTRVATREELFGDPTRSRNVLAAAVSDNSAAEALMWVYAVTRVLPLVRQIEESF